MTDNRDIFSGTMAELTYAQVEQAIGRGAVALWAFGVIEQHGPHLPTGTDVYLPSGQLRGVKAELTKRGIESLIVPPYYWGVNQVSAAFPASFQVRPEIMIELMVDVLASLSRDKVKHVFCVTGHGEALHNKSIYDALVRSRRETGMDASFLADERLIGRLGIDKTDAAVTPFASWHDPNQNFIDLHAGKTETSMMLSLRPDIVSKQLGKLEPVLFTPDDLAVWRKGYDFARGKAPAGYVGDPSKAQEALGAAELGNNAVIMADAIEARMKRLA